MTTQEENELSLTQSKVDEFKKLILELHKTNSLFISRVPKQTKEEFKKFAFDEFEGDYGVALRWLWDSYKGLLAPKDAQLTGLLADLNQRLTAIEVKKEEPSGKEIRLGDGGIITRRR